MGDQQLRHFEDRYFISTEGRIFSKLKYAPIRKHQKLHNKFFINGIWYKELKTGKTIKGYLRIKLPIGSFSLHRLVAKLFINNPKNLSQVNHKDGVKSNNNINNLEWVDNRENLDHALKSGLRKSLDYDKIRYLLQNSFHTQGKIADMCGCSLSAIEVFINKCKVQRPERYEASKETVKTRSKLVGSKWYPKRGTSKVLA